MVSSRPRVSRLEFYIALALAGLAQEGQGEIPFNRINPPNFGTQSLHLHLTDISIEKVAQLAQEDALPEPVIDLASVTTSTITPIPALDTSTAATYTQSPDADPWTFPIPATPTSGSSHPDALPNMSAGISGGRAPVALTGGLGKNWWNRQVKAGVSIIPEKQGFILARYTAYLVSPDVWLFLSLNKWLDWC